MKIRTLCDLVYDKIPEFNKADCLMAKSAGTYRSITAAELCNTVETLASKLLDLNIQKGDRVGLLSENRPEWAYADLAILCCGAITVPIYGTLPAMQIEYLFRDSGMEVVFVSNEMQLNKIGQILKSGVNLKCIILFDPVSSLLPPGILFSQAYFEGEVSLKKNPDRVKKRASEVREEDVFSIIYTSGTTGEPKGVMLTHKNLISNIEAIQAIFTFRSDDRALSFLPLSHIFERMAGYYTMLNAGTTIAYAESIESIVKNLAEVKPTLLISVPRVYEKFYSRVMDNVASEQGLKKKLAVWALRIAQNYASEKLEGRRKPSIFLAAKYALADKLVLSKIRRRLGGRLRLLISGGAALPKQLGPFFYGLGLTILEGYGLTETSPVIAVNRPEHFKFGTVGKPLSNVEVKIAEDGEILTRGPHVMKGYFNKPKETAEAITSDGWFHTGDIGEIDAEGFLRITDRKKDLIKTSGGKYIAPQFIENSLKTSKYVTQIVVLGDKRKFPCALIVPNVANLKKLGAEKSIPENQLFSNREILSEIQRDLDELSKDLAPFERVKKVALLEKEFSIESGELTPSLKIKRNFVERKYKDLIDALYTEPVLV